MLVKNIKPVDGFEVTVSAPDGNRGDETRVFLDVERYNSESIALYVNLTTAEALDLAEALVAAVRTTLNA
jgi:hypothetical protein